MIQNREALEESDDHVLALDCLEGAIDGASPARATRSAVSLDGDVLQIDEDTFDLSSYEEILVVGGGKAGNGVARALSTILGDRITGGIVVAPEAESFGAIETVAGDHPIPSATNVEATTEMLSTVDSEGEDALVFAVVTGGASAMLAAPADDVTLQDLQKSTRTLLDAGASIDEINAVRKHLSASKGGTLARRAAPATVVGLLFSDVVGNDPSVIGSGPTVPDETTYAEALAVFDRYDVTPPSTVAAHLNAGSDGNVPETPDGAEDAFERVHNHLVGDNRVALDAAADVARVAGFRSLVLTASMRGEAREVAKPLVAIAEEVAETGQPVEPPAVLLAGGETTVTVAGDPGEGGPNQELVLSAAIEGLDEAVIAAGDTDGLDGSSDVAGAITDETTVTDADDARAHLEVNDAGTYLSETGATIETGPTGTNVNDVVVLVVREESD